jgi:hypothetical protein
MREEQSTFGLGAALLLGIVASPLLPIVWPSPATIADNTGPAVQPVTEVTPVAQAEPHIKSLERLR